MEILEEGTLNEILNELSPTKGRLSRVTVSPVTNLAKYGKNDNFVKKRPKTTANSPRNNPVPLPSQNKQFSKKGFGTNRGANFDILLENLHEPLQVEKRKNKKKPKLHFLLNLLKTQSTSSFTPFQSMLIKTIEPPLLFKSQSQQKTKIFISEQGSQVSFPPCVGGKSNYLGKRKAEYQMKKNIIMFPSSKTQRAQKIQLKIQGKGRGLVKNTGKTVREESIPHQKAALLIESLMKLGGKH